MSVSVADVLSVFGLTGRIAKAVAAAVADPTSKNIAEVNRAYLANGQTPPAKLVALLVKLNQEQHPEDPYTAHVAADIVPLLVIGTIILVLLFSKKR